MRCLIALISVLLVAASCKQEPIEKEWQFDKLIPLNNINATGMQWDDHRNLWISDTDHNRIIKIDTLGTILEEVEGFDRPMHLSFVKNKLYIPEYGKDSISVLDGQKKTYLRLNDALDAPAGVAVWQNEIAIADFYNHSILYSKDGKNYSRIGSQGHQDGQFYYPTDVQLDEDYIWVADAYNNRIQQLDKKGNILKIIGWDQNMNATTGLFVFNNGIFATDFENDRVLYFNKDGALLQILKRKVNKPTEIAMFCESLYIFNYRNSELVKYTWSPKKR